MKFDSKTHTIIHRKQKITLPYKTWCVAIYLFDAAPQIVSRATLIDQIWDGNNYVGEKALNQAMWTIRARLKDNARAPKYIRTIPRKGYQWIGEKIQARNITPKRIAVLTALAASTLLVLNARIEIKATPSSQDMPVSEHVNNFNGYSIVSSPRKILVNYPQGCLITLLTSAEKSFSTPIFSKNGNNLAFRVTRAGQCKLIVLDLKLKKYHKFETCPVTSATAI